MGGRDERRQLLRRSKGFTCGCGRCTGVDLEAALPCVACAPLAQRPHGFMAPAHTHHLGIDHSGANRSGLGLGFGLGLGNLSPNPNSP